MIPNNHTRPHFALKSLRIMILAFMMFSLLIGCGSGGNSSNNEPDTPEDPITISGKTVFGPLTGATVRLYEAPDLNVPVYTTTTNTTEDMGTGGVFEIPEDKIDDDALYVLSVSGGLDIDADDDGQIDAKPVKNKGEIRQVLWGEDLLNGDIAISVLTEMVYQHASYMIAAEYPEEQIVEDLNKSTRLLLGKNLNGELGIDYRDLLLWDPVEDKENPETTSLRQKKSLYDYWAKLIHNGGAFEEEVQIHLSGVIGNVRTGSKLFSVDVSNDIAYVGQEADILTINVKDPGKPVNMPKRIPVKGARKIIVSKNLLYAAADIDGFKIADVSDMQIIKSIDTPGSAVDFTIIDNYAVVADGPAGLQVIDINKIETASITGGWDTPTTGASSVAISKDYAYVADGINGLHILDLSADINNPKFIKTVDLSGDAGRVAITDECAYVTDELMGLHVVDIRIPEQASKVKTKNTPGTGGQMKDIEVKGDTLYMTDGDSGLHVLDIKDPLNPITTATVPPIDTSAVGLSVSDDFAFVIDSNGAFKIVDLENVNYTSPVKSLDLPAGTETIESLFVSGDYAFAIPEASPIVHVINVEKTKAPSYINQITMPGVVLDMDFFENFAYVATAGSGLQVIEIKDNIPTIEGSLNFPGAGDVSIISIYDQYALVIVNDNLFYMIDISTPKSPKLASKVLELQPQNPDKYIASDISVIGNYAYIGYNSDLPVELRTQYGLQVIDISTPDNLSIETPFSDTSVDYSDVMLNGNFGFVFGVEDRDILYTLDLQKPLEPKTLSSSRLPAFSDWNEISNNYIYLENTIGGIQLINVQKATEPVNIGFAYTLGGKISDIDVLDKYVYAVTKMNRLFILRAAY